MQDSNREIILSSLWPVRRMSETASHGPINSDRPGQFNIAPTFLIGKN
jgi:hypothetical protein